MNYLVLSDLHLTHHFYPRKFDKLKSLIEQHDRLIINGDMWDGYFTTFDLFLNSNWQDIFPLMKKKRTVYIYGNHDEPAYFEVDDRVEQFSDYYGSDYHFELGGKQYYLEHGHKIIPELSARWSYIKKYRLVMQAWTIPFNLGEVAFMSITGKPSPTIRVNNPFLKWKEQNLPKETYMVVGHMHAQQIDHERRFVDIGYFRWGLAQYCTIDEQGIQLHSERY